MTAPAERNYGDGEGEKSPPPDENNVDQVSTPDIEQSLSKWATELPTISYLVLFSILGTLARLGLQSLTTYPGGPVVFGTLWANLSGCLIIGFLYEDRKLFKAERGIPRYHQELQQARLGSAPGDKAVDLAAAKKAHIAVKKSIPLYIGLATGFCGSITSFSSFMRDAFLALSNDLPLPPGSDIKMPSRNGGDSLLAVLAVIITTLSVCIAAFHLGTHLALLLEPFTPSLPYTWTYRIIDRLSIPLALAAWLSLLLLCILLPSRSSSLSPTWHHHLFSLLLSPPGCLLRFYLSLHLNGRLTSFPLGTFTINILGTAILGTAWDLQRAPGPLVGVLACQVLQGLQDGFCGCATTVSTWVAEMVEMRDTRGRAYVYGVGSVGVGLAVLVLVMGGLRWTRGFGEVMCLN